MKNKDVRIGLVLLAIFLALYGISFTFPKSAMSETHTGAAFFPRIILLTASGLTLLLVCKNLFHPPQSVRSKALSGEQRKRVLGSMGLAALFGLGAVVMGTFISLFLLIVGFMLLWGIRRKGTILITAVGTTALVYIVFTELLEVQFPAGFLF